jgi:hypothetical protein
VQSEQFLLRICPSVSETPRVHGPVSIACVASDHCEEHSGCEEPLGSEAPSEQESTWVCGPPLVCRWRRCGGQIHRTRGSTVRGARPPDERTLERRPLLRDLLDLVLRLVSSVFAS